MAALGEVPFGRYYGSVDATPLFVVLAGAYYERTGDSRLHRASCGRISKRRSSWIDRYGDPDGDGFVEYCAAHRRRPRATRAGRTRTTPSSTPTARWPRRRSRCARCRATSTRPGRRAPSSRRALGMAERARELRDTGRGACASASRRRFWCEELGTYALALDGDKRPCRVRTSNAGQCLFTGIASDGARARAWRDTLMDDAVVFRLGHPHLAASEARYNPMSYHNGSVWPHDNALIAAGWRATGCKDGRLRVLTRPVRRQPLRRPAPAARAVLRLRAAARRRPDALSGRLVRRRPGPPAPSFCCCSPA